MRYCLHPAIFTSILLLYRVFDYLKSQCLTQFSTDPCFYAKKNRHKPVFIRELTLYVSVELNTQPLTYFFIGFDDVAKPLTETVLIKLLASFLIPDATTIG